MTLLNAFGAAIYGTLLKLPRIIDEKTPIWGKTKIEKTFDVVQYFLVIFCAFIVLRIVQTIFIRSAMFYGRVQYVNSVISKRHLRVNNVLLPWNYRNGHKPLKNKYCTHSE